MKSAGRRKSGRATLDLEELNIAVEREFLEAIKSRVAHVLDGLLYYEFKTELKLWMEVNAKLFGIFPMSGGAAKPQYH